MAPPQYLSPRLIVASKSGFRRGPDLGNSGSGNSGSELDFVACADEAARMAKSDSDPDFSRFFADPDFSAGSAVWVM